MKDEIGVNPMTVSGTLALVPGALSFDPDQGLAFDSGESATAPDSVSLSDTNSFSIEMFLKFAAYPGVTRNVVSKTNSYSVQIQADGKLVFNVANGASVGIVSPSAIGLAGWHHVVVVCNQNFAGTPQFGTTSFDASSEAMSGDTTKFGTGSGANNLRVSQRTVVETGLVTALSMPIARDDEVWNTDLRMAIFADAAGAPGGLLVASDAITIPSIPVRPPTFQWVTLPAAGIVTPGLVWMGYQMGRTNGQSWTTYAASGTTKFGADTYADGAPSTFPSVAGTNGAQTLTSYADYTPIGRTGLEGKLLMYIDGQLVQSTNYSAGVADDASAFLIGALVGMEMDELSFWSRALTPVEIGTHYTAR